VRNHTNCVSLKSICASLSVKLCIFQIKLKVDSKENHYFFCYQMSDFKAKMYLNLFRLELRPSPRWGSLQRSPEGPGPIPPVMGISYSKSSLTTITFSIT